jgi:hypothetical protein
MASESSRKVEDTTLRRVAADVGFNARVEPFWHTYRRMESRWGFFERRRERKRLERVVEVVNGGIRSAGSQPAGWDAGEGDCVCNLRVARMGLIREFKNYAGLAADGKGAETWPHLFALRDRPCLLVPAEFPRPITVQPAGDEEPFPVSSVLKAKEELADVNGRLRIDETFAIRKMVDYMDATERDIEIYEKRLGTSEGFWAKFAYVLLRKLTDVSSEKRLPVLFA